MVKRLQYLAGLIKEDLDLSYNPMSAEERRIDRGCLQEEFDLSDNPFSNLLYNPSKGYNEQKLLDFFDTLDSKPFYFHHFKKLDDWRYWSDDSKQGFKAAFVAEAPSNLYLVFEVIVKPDDKGEQKICYYIKLSDHIVRFNTVHLPMIKKECENAPKSLTQSMLKKSVKSKMDSYYRTAVNGIENKNSYVMSLIDDLKKTK